jgi:hypothetical protein
VSKKEDEQGSERQEPATGRAAESVGEAPPREGAGSGAPAGKPAMTDEELLDAIAGRVVNMRLGVPAVFFLESTKPLSFVGSQALVFLEPFVQAFLSTEAYSRFARMMEDRQNVEALIRRIESRDEDLRTREKQEKERRAEEKRRQREAR